MDGFVYLSPVEGDTDWLLCLLGREGKKAGLGHREEAAAEAASLAPVASAAKPVSPLQGGHLPGGASVGFPPRLQGLGKPSQGRRSLEVGDRGAGLGAVSHKYKLQASWVCAVSQLHTAGGDREAGMCWGR